MDIRLLRDFSCFFIEKIEIGIDEISRKLRKFWCRLVQTLCRTMLLLRHFLIIERGGKIWFLCCCNCSLLLL